MSTAKHDLKNSKRTGSKSSKRITNHPTKHHFSIGRDLVYQIKQHLFISIEDGYLTSYCGSVEIYWFVWNDSILTLWQLGCIGKHIPFPWHRWLKELQESS